MKVTKFGERMAKVASLREWADALGISHETVRDLMRNKEVDPAVKVKVDAVTSIAVSFLKKSLG